MMIALVMYLALVERSLIAMLEHGKILMKAVHIVLLQVAAMHGM